METVRLELAGEEDAAAIAALRLAVARDLTAKFGPGVWSLATDTVEGVRIEVRGQTVYLARHDGVVWATLRLADRNPWVGDTSFFTTAARPVYLTSMAVSPTHQRCGIGRACLAAVEKLSRERGAGAIRLDCFDAPAGAAEFYRRCGFTAVHRGLYLGTPLVWLERVWARE